MKYAYLLATSSRFSLKSMLNWEPTSFSFKWYNLWSVVRIYNQFQSSSTAWIRCIGFENTMNLFWISRTVIVLLHRPEFLAISLLKYINGSKIGTKVITLLVLQYMWLEKRGVVSKLLFKHIFMILWYWKYG